MRIYEFKHMFPDVVAQFKQQFAADIKKGCARNRCDLPASRFMVFAKKHGYNAKRVVGTFKIDNPEFDEWDFYDEEIVRMKAEGFDPDNKEDRIKFAQKYDMIEQLKLVPHHWNVYKGKIIDFTADAQFVQTGLAADTKKNRYKTD